LKNFDGIEKSSRGDEFHAFLEDNQIVSLGHIFEDLTTVN